MKTGIDLIAEERRRQQTVEGWDENHDDQHDAGELADAAVCYAMPPNRRKHDGYSLPLNWPFEDMLWKPSPNDRVRELVKAGALIAAEIDRIQRISSAPAPSAGEEGKGTR